MRDVARPTRRILRFWFDPEGPRGVTSYSRSRYFCAPTHGIRATSSDGGQDQWTRPRVGSADRSTERPPFTASSRTDGVPTPTFLEYLVSKRTFQPNTRRRAKTHGFRLRMRTRAGRAILAARRRKGRDELSA